MLHTIILLQSNRDCFSRFVDVFLASRGPSFRTILSSLQLVLCRVVAVKCQFSGPLGVSGTENRVSLKLRLAGVGSVAPLHYNKTESAICFSLMCFLLPADLHSELILSSLQLVLCHVAGVKRLSLHLHSVDYIFSCPLGSFGSS